MNEQLAGTVALVTGAARGIGLAVAQALEARGARVALVDVDEAALMAASLTASIDGSMLPICADVSRGPEAQRAVRETVERLGQLDILVNNAGICPTTAFDRIAEDEWDRVLAINLKGAFLFCQAALPHIQHSGPCGRVINVASVSGQMGGIAVGAHYSASKAGLIGLTRTLARLLAPYKATANCVAPATTDTELTAGWAPEVRERVQSQIPLGRFARAEEIGEAAAFLASERAGFITGATLDVNGGLYLR